MLLALAVRLWGINWQLPSALYFDEQKYYGWAAAVADGRPPERTDFRNPSLFRHLLRAEYAVSDRVFASDGSEARAVRRMLVARITTAALGAFAVVFVALTAVTLFSVGAGVVAGLLMALSPLHVHLSHIAINDVAASFFLCAGIFAGGRLWAAPALRWVLIAGATAGLAAAAKYNFGVVLLVPVVALFVHARESRLSYPRVLALLTLIGLAFAAALVAAMPEIALTPSDVLDGMRDQAMKAEEAPEEQPDAPVTLLFAETIVKGLGLPAAVMTFVGAVWLARERPGVALGLLIAPVVYLAVMLRGELFAARFALPLIPFAAVLAGAGALALSRWARAPWRPTVTLSLLLLALTVPEIRDVLHHNTLATTPDTRVLAREWLAANARGERVAAQTYALTPVWAGQRGIERVNVVDRFMSLMQPRVLTRLECDRVRYVLISSFTYQRHAGLDPTPPPGTGYELLGQHGQRVATISPYKVDQSAPTHPDDTAIPFWFLHAYERPGPRIDIYRLPDDVHENCR